MISLLIFIGIIALFVGLIKPEIVLSYFGGENKRHSREYF